MCDGTDWIYVAENFFTNKVLRKVSVSRRHLNEVLISPTLCCSFP